MRRESLLLLSGVLGSVLSAESPWWAGALIYQIEVGSFKDSNGDCVGDLRGITLSPMIFIPEFLRLMLLGIQLLIVLEGINSRKL
jgi:hypothetical protein